MQDKDVSKMIERLLEFEARAGIRLDALSATLVGFFRHETVQIYGEVYAQDSDTMTDDVEITVAVYDSKGKVVGARSALIDAAQFFKFQIFGVQVNGPVQDVTRIRIVPKIKVDQLVAQRSAKPPERPAKPPISRALIERLSRLARAFDQGGTVYLVTCLAPGPDLGKRYVGLTTGQLPDREFGHHLAANFAVADRGPLQEAILRYASPDAFKWEILGRANSWQELREFERASIAEHGTHISTGRGFNLSWGGEGMSPKARLLIRVENEMLRRRSYLDSGNEQAIREFELRFEVEWESLDEAKQTELVEYDAIRYVFLSLFREYSSTMLLKEAARTADPAVLAAARHTVHEKQMIVDEELRNLLEIVPNKQL